MAADDPSSAYLANIPDPLPRDEQRRLAERMIAGDDDARATLIETNLRLVIRIARKFMRPGRSLEDLIAEGNLALVNAIDSWDPDRGKAPAGWAWMIVHRHLITALKQHASRQRRDDRYAQRAHDEQLSRATRAACDGDEFAEACRRLDEVDPRTADVLRRRIGLTAGSPQRQRQIALELGVSAERIRQLEQNALSQVRRRMFDGDDPKATGPF